MDHQGIRVRVHVRPSSSRTAVGGRFDGDLVVRVRARAVDGAANDDVLDALAVAFSRRRRHVSFVHLTTSRSKVVFIEGDTTDLTRRVEELLGLED